MPEKLLSIQEAARKLKVSTKTLRRWEASGILVPNRTTGAHRRYTEEQLKTFVIKLKEDKKKRKEIAQAVYAATVINQPVTPSPAPQAEASPVATDTPVTDPQLPLIKPQPVRTSTPPVQPEPIPSMQQPAETPITPQPASPQPLTSPPPTFKPTRVYPPPRNGDFLPSPSLSSFLPSMPSKRQLFVYGASAMMTLAFLFAFFAIGQVVWWRNSESGVAINSSHTSILGAVTQKIEGYFNVNIPAYFNEELYVKNKTAVTGDATFSGDVYIKGKKLEISAQVSAPNLVNSIIAGKGIATTGINDVTLTNTGVTSLQGQTGDVTLQAGSGISISGNKISSTISAPSASNSFATITDGSTSFSAGSSNDTLTFASGTGISLNLDSTNKKLTITGTSSSPVSSVGDGLMLSSGVASVSLLSSGTGTGSTASPSGLEFAGGSNELTLLQGCNNSQVLAWDSALKEWKCAAQGATGIINVKSNNAVVTSTADTLDFSNEFSLSESPAGEINIALDYATSHITRDNQTQTISSAWTFSGGLVISGLSTSTGTNLCVDGSNNLIKCSGGGVTSLNSLSGAISIANATAGAGTVTINDASTTGKGIAQFNSTNFSASSGTINTIQDIASSSSPTFTGLTLSAFSTAGVVHNNGSGVLSSSALNLAGGSNEVSGLLPATNGGTGLNASAATGVATVSSGTWSIAASLATSLGGLGANVTAVGAGELLYSTGTTTYGHLAAGNSGECLTSGGAGAPVWTSCAGATGIATYWNQTNGVLSPFNSTVDLLIGGNSTTSAKFAFTNVNNGTPTASISAGLNGATYITANGIIATTAKQSLTLGSSETGNISVFGLGTGVVHSTNGVLSSSAVTNAELQNSSITVSGGTGLGVSGSPVSLGGTLTLSNTGVTSNVAGSGISVSGATGAVTISNTGVLSIVGGSGGTAQSGALTLANSQSSGGTLTIDDASTTGKGIAQFNSTNFSASSGTINTVQNINSAASPTFSSLTLSNFTGNNAVLYGTAGSGAFASATTNSTGLCLVSGASSPSWTNCAGATGIATYWDQTNGVLSPFNSTVDLLIGGNSSDSAKFAFIGNNLSRGSQTASFSADLVLDKAGNIQTTNNQSLTIGGSTTGNIILSPNNGSGLVISNSDINLASGKALLIGGSSVLNGTTLGSTVVTSSLTTVGALASGSIASGFGSIFTTNTIQGSDITASGTTGFTGSGNGAGLTFNGSGNHTLSASSGTLQLGAVTLTGALNGNSQNITGLGTINGLAITANTGTITTGIWNGTVIGAQYGGTGLNTSASTGVPTISSGTWSVGATLSTSLGGTGQNFGSTAQGSLPYFSGSGVMSALAPSTAGWILSTNGAGANPTWIDPGTLPSSNFWDISSGLITPKLTSTLDFSLGGTSTTSAKFGIFGINNARGSQTATLSGSLTFDAAASLQTTSYQSLNIGGATTGNIFISPQNGNGTLTLNTASSNGLIINGSAGINVSGTAQCVTTTNGIVTGTGVCQLGTEQWVAENGTLHPGILSMDLLVGGNSTASAKFAFINNAGGLPTASISAGLNGSTYITADGTLATTAMQTLTLGGPTTGNINLYGIGSGVLHATNGVLSTSQVTNAELQNSSITVSGGTGLGVSGSPVSLGGTLTLSNTGVTSNVAGSGISVSGATGAVTISNTGVLSIVGGTGGTAQSGTLTLANSQSSGGTLTIDDASTTGKGIAQFNSTNFSASSGTINTVQNINSAASPTFSSLTLSNFTGNNAVLYGTAGSGAFASATTNSTGLCLVSGASAPSWTNCAGATGIQSYWTEANGALFPDNATVDFLLGGSATTSAKFAVTGLATDNPVATISAANGNGLYLTNNGVIQTTNNQTLTLGGSTTGNINLLLTSPDTFQINGTTILDSSRNLLGIAGLSTSLNPTAANTYTLGTGTGNQFNTIYGNALYQNGNQVCDTSGNCIGGGGGGIGGSGTINYIAKFSSDGSHIGNSLLYDTGSALALGTQTPVGFLTINGGYAGNAALTVNQTGSGSDILTASSAGSTKFVVNTDGNIQFTGNTSFLSTLTSAATGSRTYTFPDANGTICLQGSSNCGFALGTNYWQLNSNLLSPSNSTYDFAVGGTSSTSANFAILGVTGARGTQVATLSGSLVLDTAGSIQTTNMQTLTLGGTTTGNVSVFGIGTGIVHSTNGVLSSSAVTNAELQNSSITVSGGTGLGVSGSPVSLGGTLTLSNTGVTSSVAGSGISVSGATGAVTISNTGVLSIVGGTGGTAQSGTLTLANSQSSGGTLTIDDASTTGKGIAQFNSTNFSASSGTINLVQNINSAASPTFSSLTLSNFTGNNAVLYGTAGSGAFASATTNSTGLCLVSGLSAPSWTNCAGATGITTYWDQVNGVLTPKNETVDFLLGGVSSDSAKFAILNINGSRGNQTASISGSLTLDAAGSLQTTNKQTLTIGGGQTGNIDFYNTSNFLTSGGALTLAGTITANSSSTINGLSISSGTITSGTWNGNAISSQYGGTGQNFSSSTGVPSLSSGTWSVNATLAPSLGGTGQDFGSSTGVITVSSGTFASSAQLSTALGGLGASVTAAGAGEILYSTGATAYGHLAAAGSSGLCLISGGAGAPSWTDCAGATGIGNYWDQTNGVLTPKNETVDFLLGGVSSDSAKFAVLNINNGTPTASVSSGLNGNGAFIDANGNIQTTNKQTLTLGGGSSGNVAVSGIGTGVVHSTNGVLSSSAVTNAELQNSSITVSGGTGLGVSGSPVSLGGTLTLSNTGVTSNVAGSGISVSGATGAVTISNTGVLSIVGGTGGTAQSGTLTLANSQSSGGTLTIDDASTTGKGIAQFNSTNFSASSGTINLVQNINSAASPTFAGLTLSNFTGNNSVLYGTSGTGVLASATTNTSGLCLVSSGANPSWSNCASATGLTTYWNQTNGVLTPFNSTVDLLIGGNSSDSAKFAFIGSNLSRGSQTASFSADLVLDKAGNIQTTNNQTLTIGGNTTGNITLTPNNGNGTVTVNGSLTAKTGRGATITVAASNSSATTKAQADYVATGTDDQTTINNAITALPAGGGTVLLLEGTYSIGNTSGNPITITKSNVTLTGSGKGTLLQRAGSTASNRGVITLGDSISGYSGITVSNLSVDGQKGTYSGAGNMGIYILSLVTNSKITNTWVDSPKGYGIGINGNSSATNISIDNNVITNSGSIGIEVLNANNNKVTTNDVESNTSVGIELDGSTNNTISNNISKSNGTHGILIATSSTSNTVSNNIVQSNTGEGIFLLADSNTITGNTAASNPVGFYISSNFNVVTGNNSISSTQQGIYLNGNSNTVTGNTVNEVGGSYDGIYITSASNNIVSGNRVNDTSGSNYGIYVQNSGSTANYITGNEIAGAGWKQLLVDSGTGTVQQQKNQFAIDGSSYGKSLLTLNQTNTDWNILAASSSGTTRLVLGSSGFLGLGTETPTSELYVTRPLSFGVTGKALAIFDQIENQDIFTASSSGVTKFVIDKNGNLGIGGSLASSSNYITAPNFVLNTSGQITTGTWQGTAIGSQYGGTGQNFSASTGVPSLSSGTWSVNATLAPSLGGTGQDFSGSTGVITVSSGTFASSAQLSTALGGLGASVTAAGAGEILYSTGATAYGHLAAAGSSGLCLISGGAGAPSWTDCAGATGIGNYWDQTNGVLTPKNETVDFLLGGVSSDSAKFAIININGNRGTQTASVSGNLTLDAAGSLQTTNKQTLTIGGSETGNIDFYNSSNFLTSGGALTLAGTITANTSNTINGLSISSGTITSGTWNGTAIGSQYGGTGQNFSASTGVPSLSSGTWSVNAQLSTALGGTGQNFGSTAQGSLPYFSGSGVMSALAPSGTAGWILSSNGAGANPSWIDPGTLPSSNYWDITNGLITPKLSSTLDFTLGGTSTTSAKFAVLGINDARGSQTASISGNLVLDAAGSLQTTNSQTLTIGGNTTGSIWFKPNNNSNGLFLTGSNVGIGNQNPQAALDVTSGSHISAAVNKILFGSTGITVGELGYDGGMNDEIRIGAQSDKGLEFVTNDTIRGYFTNTGLFGLGTFTPIAQLQVNGANGSNAAFILNQLNSGDIFTASSAGTPIFSITNSGGLKLGSSEGSSGQCLLSGGVGSGVTWGSCDAVASVNVWNLTNGAITAGNSTADLLLGGASTTSAKFAIINVNGARGSQIASLSGSLTLDAAGSLQTTNNQTLTIGGTTTGNIVLSPLNGANGANVTINGGATISGTLAAKTGRGATITVAASDSSATEKAQADYVADGTNDEVEINNAISALPSTGGTVQLMSGTFTTGATITIAKSNISLIGSGKATVIKRGWDNGNVITIGDGVSSYSGITVSLMSIDGQKATYTNANNHGIKFVSGITQSAINKTWLNNNKGNGINLYSSPTTSSSDLIESNNISNSGSAGILIYGTYVTVNNNILSSNNDGVDLTSSTNTIVSNNSILSSSTYGISMNVCQYCVVSNNNIDGGYNSIYVYGSAHNNVLGNTLTNSSNAAIAFFVSDYNNFSFNNITNTSGTYAISTDDIAGGGSNNSIIGNTIYDNVGSNYAIYLFNTYSTYLSGNIFRGTGANGIYTDSNSASSTVYGSQLANSGNDLILSSPRYIGIGTTSPTSLLSVIGGSMGGNAAMLVNQTGASTNDIFAASASGVTKFVIKNDGTASSSAGFTINGLGALQSTNNQTLTIGGNSTGNIVLSPNGGTGNIQLTNFSTNGGLLYTNGSGILAQTGAGSTNQCLISNGGGAPTWTSCTNASSSPFQSSNGIITQLLPTQDVLFGGTSTTSATFAFIGNNLSRGSQVASFSADLVLDKAGTIQTTKNQTLTIGGNSTGQINFYNTSNFMTSAGALTLASTINANTTNTINGLSINGGTITAGTWNATAIGTQYGGTGQNFGSTAQGSLPYFSGSGVMSALAPSTAGWILSTNGAGQNPSWIDPGSLPSTNFWDIASGIITPKLTSTLDFTLGGTSTASAKFAILGVNNARGQQTASVSGNLVLDAAGSLQTTNNQTLTIGGNTTGNILLNSDGANRVGIGNANPQALLDVSTNSLIGAPVNNILFGSVGNAMGELGYDGSMFNEIRMGSQSNVGLELVTNDTIRGYFTNTGLFGLGTFTPVAQLQVNGANGSNAAFILNQANNGDILAASSSGTTKFVIKNDGTASTSGNLVINAAGSLQTTNNQTLTIGGNSTGNIALNPLNGQGKVSISGTSSNPGTLLAVGNGDPFTVNGMGQTILNPASASPAASIITNLTSINKGQTDTAYTLTSAFPVNQGKTHIATYNGYVYSVGGNSGSPSNSSYYARVNADGTLNNWIQGPSLASVVYLNPVVAYNGYLYSMGGNNNSASVTTVSYAKLNSDGSIGPWSTTTALGTATQDGMAVAYGGYMYFMGGYNSGSGLQQSTIFSAPINSNGTLGAWTSQNTFPYGAGAHVEGAAITAYNGFIYVAGGWDGSSARGDAAAAPISNGTVGTWTSTNALPASAKSYLPAYGSTVNGQFILGGGSSTSSSVNAQSTVWIGQMSNGVITWNTAATSLPNTSFQGSGAVLGNVFIFLGDNTPTTNVYTTSIQSVAFALNTTKGFSQGDLFELWNGNVNKFSIDYAGNIIASAGAQFRPNFDAVNALGLANASGTNILSVDTFNNRIGIGTNLPSSTLDVAGTASISGGLTLTTTSTLQSMNNQTLTIGGNTTGDISFKPGNVSTPSLYLASNGNVGIGTANPSSLLDLRNTTTAVASISATTNGTGLVLGGDGTIQSLRNGSLTIGGNTTGNIILNPRNGVAGGAILPATDNVTDLGSSPSARFRNVFIGPGSLHIICTTGDGCAQTSDFSFGVNTATSNFEIGLNGNTGNRNPLLTLAQSGQVNITGSLQVTGNVITNGTNGVTIASAACVKTQNGIVIGSAACPVGSTSSPFQSLNEVIVQNNLTQDFLLGGTSTASAKFAILGINNARGSQTASVSGNLVLDAAGSLQTTNNQTLTVGGNTTGDIYLRPTNSTGMVRIVHGPTGTGGLILQDSETDSAAKIGRLKFANFTNSQNPVTGLIGVSDGTRNQLYIGGNSSSENAMTVLRFFTAAALNTNSGTERMRIDETGAVSIGNVQALGTAAKGTLDVKAISGTLPVASISGATSNAVLLVDNSGVGDLITASTAGLTRFVVDKNGNLGLAGSAASSSNYLSSLNFVVNTSGQITTGTWQATAIGTQYGGTGQNFGSTAQGSLPYFSGSGVMSALAPSGTAGWILSSNGAGANPTWIDPGTLPSSNYWDITNGLITPKLSSTLDFTLGGTSTTSAKFAVLGINNARGQQTASVSGNLVLDAAGSLQTTNNQTLTIGGNTTGSIWFKPNNNSNGLFLMGSNVGIGNQNPQASLDVTSSSHISAAVNKILFGSTGITVGELGYDGGMNDEIRIGAQSDKGLEFVTNDTIRGYFTNTGLFGLGTFTPVAQLQVNATNGSNAGFILNQANNGDIFAASASGTTKFVIKNDGTASSSAGFTVNGVGNIQSTNNQTLTIGGGSTGNLIIGRTNQAINLPAFSNNNNSVLYAGSNGILGVAETTNSSYCLLSNGSGAAPSWQVCPTGNGVTQWTISNGAIISGNQTLDFVFGGIATSSAVFKLTGQSNPFAGTLVGASVSANTSNTALLTDNKGIGDLFAASSSGVNQFVIKNGGSVGIGTNLPNAKLDILGVSTQLRLGYDTSNYFTTQVASNGLTTFDAIGSGAAFNFKDAVSLGISGSSNGLLSFNNSAGVSAASITTNTSGDLLLQSSTGLVNIGVGSGDITLDPGTNNIVANLTSGNFLAQNNGVNILKLSSSGTVPTASVSGKTSFAALLVDNSGAGDLITASSSGGTKFKLGNSGQITVYGNVLPSADNTFDLGSSPSARFKNVFVGPGSLHVICTTGDGCAQTSDYSFGVNTTTGDFRIGLNGNAGNNNTILQIGQSGTVGVTGNLNVTGSFAANTSSSTITKSSFDIGANSINGGTLSVASVSGKTSFAALVVDNSGTGDIFTASTSGLTRFTLTNNGTASSSAGFTINGVGNIQSTRNQTLTLGGGSTGNLIIGRASQIITLPGFDCSGSGNGGKLTTTSGGVLTCAADTSSGGTTTAFDTANGAIRPGNTTLDTLLGGISSSAASFKITGYDSPFAGTAVTASVSGRTTNVALLVDNAGSGDIFAASSSGLTRFVVKQNGVVQIGSDTNGIVFDYVNGPTASNNGIYSGTARPIKTITLSPEYAGAILTASGSATTTGTITTDASASASFRTYYEWSSSQTSLQDYTIVARVTLPNDFSAWATSTNAMTVDYETQLTGNDENKLDIIIYNSSSSAPVYMSTGLASATVKTWTTRNIVSTDLTGGAQTWNTAGQTAVIYMKAYAKDSNYVHVGDIKLNYLSKF